MTAVLSCLVVVFSFWMFRVVDVGGWWPAVLPAAGALLSGVFLVCELFSARKPLKGSCHGSM